jgi:hypothetical protein
MSAGPTTHDQPTGGGDREIICDGCGEAVPDAHTWAECCAGQRKRIDALTETMFEVEHERDEAIAQRDKAMEVLRDAQPFAYDALRAEWGGTT